eukprot:6199519-Pleurochrysis_carterae.AAC.1
MYRISRLDTNTGKRSRCCVRERWALGLYTAVEERSSSSPRSTLSAAAATAAAGLAVPGFQKR